MALNRVALACSTYFYVSLLAENARLHMFALLDYRPRYEAMLLAHLRRGDSRASLRLVDRLVAEKIPLTPYGVCSFLCNTFAWTCSLS